MFLLISAKRGTMYTKNILMIITIILFGISNVYASGTLKACFVNYYQISGMEKTFIRFPDDGGKPYGTQVEQLIILIKRLNLNLEIVRGQGEEIIVSEVYKLSPDGIKYCNEKMKTGEVDIMPSL